METTKKIEYIRQECGIFGKWYDSEIYANIDKMLEEKKKYIALYKTRFIQRITEETEME